MITKRRSADESQFRRLGIRRILVLAGTLTLLTVLAGPLILLTATRAQAQPRMISYGYPNCLACHVSVQGRGLLNSYGRGIEIAQSYSKKDLTAILLGRAGNTEDVSGNWDGRFGNLLADFILASRLNQRIDSAKADPTLAALYRQVIFLGENDAFRINTEVGFLDSGLPYTPLGPNRFVTGGDVVFLKKRCLNGGSSKTGRPAKRLLLDVTTSRSESRSMMPQRSFFI